MSERGTNERGRYDDEGGASKRTEKQLARFVGRDRWRASRWRRQGVAR